MPRTTPVRRVDCERKAANTRFLVDGDVFHQYHTYYNKRLLKTKEQIVKNLAYKWPNTNYPVVSLSGIPESGDCIIIGTLFKRMKLQPDVVRELSSGNFEVSCERYFGSYTSQEDRIVLQDAEESILLTGNIDPKLLVTGVVAGLFGYAIKDGSEFLVLDICYAEPRDNTSNGSANQGSPSSSQSPKKPRMSPLDDHLPSSQTGDDNLPIYLMVICDLNFNQLMGKRVALVKALQRLIDFVWGGIEYEDDERSSRIARILVVGNSLSDRRFEIASSLSQEEDKAVPKPFDAATEMKKSKQLMESSESILTVKHMDNFFAELSRTINIDVMPGINDPTTHLFPQQPIHPCILPKASSFKSFNCVTNPYHAFYNKNVEILATAGQNIDIVSNFSEIKDPIEIMKSHLKWGHCAPSAPDNLFSVPFDDSDPFTIDFKPDIYLAGCQDEFRIDHYSYDSNDPCDRNENSSSNRKKTIVLTIPRFSQTFSCVLINLKNLQEIELVNLGSTV